MSRARQDPEKAIRACVPTASRLLLAVSGGKDSCCLLHACVSVAREKQFHIEVAHVDHGLRRSSSGDAEFVRELCKSHQLKFHLLKKSGAPKSENVEAWGRRVRYEFFRRVADASSLEWILTAHNANDVAETFLMRLLANKELYSIEQSSDRSRCLRPLLSVTRSEIESYIKRNKLQSVEDESNRDTRFLRNKVRHVLIPFLEKEFDPRIAEVLALRASSVDEDAVGLRLMAEEELRSMSSSDSTTAGWLKELKRKLAKTPPVLKWRIAERLLMPRCGFSPGRAACEAACEVVEGKRLAVELPGGLCVRRSAGVLRIIKRSGRS